ncbi:hypothetical protein N658DRAFT_508576 [Parathielavia hyrcaniae]|uniref:Uncharacterized protein n=1 Tax=Parathielavia hyrcaniae TaxID=113614 RepID=A0AAN6Q208_9PEZI|nr:hypothetical protein N658DRAFT_508576 [Parathielavia hyrcaniae]
MIPIKVLLLFSHQVAFGALLVKHSGCNTRSKQPNPIDCHHLIDAFSQADASGHITLEGRQVLEMAVGTCAGTLFNKQTTNAKISTASLAFDMKDKIYNRCVSNGMWGRWETDEYSICVWYLDPTDPRSPLRHNNGSGNKRVLSAKKKRGAGETTCIEDQQDGQHPPVQDRCRRAIDELTDSSSEAYLTVKPRDCETRIVENCVASFCNNQDYEIEFNKEVMKFYSEYHVFDPCVVSNKKYGVWEPDDGGYTLALYEAPLDEADCEEAYCEETCCEETYCEEAHCEEAHCKETHCKEAHCKEASESCLVDP